VNSVADWDIVVIGGGAAGLSAAAAAAGAGLSCLVLDRMGGGGELSNLGLLREMDGGLAGPDLAARLLEEVITAGAELGLGEVTGLTPHGNGWQVLTDEEAHGARAVILATGLAHGRLGIAGEDSFEGRGLSHCAACDGPLYRGLPVVVAGAGRWARQEARELAAIASQVTLVTQEGPVPAAAGFAVIPGRIIALEGSSGLDSVLVEPDGGGDARRLPARAVFVQTARRPALGFVPGVLARDRDGRLLTNATLASSMPGLFAAGDVRTGAAGTIAAAIADGQRAAASVRAAITPLGKAGP
jgi:thioredoxin reductase (NADPH)